ncbi:SDR family NAD(P)-dependent oxidoreductase [Comamonas composti]|uniref:SDR family NAD(P)-dependent oxidoreductase n=1 Tax=Comamonas composti TaxID=408558 RepID=UPI00040E20F8|nr:SDR family oxidoreductase [Comamonas composti]
MNSIASDLFDLGGKVAVITGASRGIGRASALQLAARGASVCVSSRHLGACEEVAAVIRAAGGQAMACEANISSQEQLAHLMRQVNEKLGRIDILVCNAATNPYYGPMEQMDDEIFLKILRNNVLSNLWLIKQVAPQMRERRDGSIIIISSIAGLKGSSTIGAYGVSKAADMQLARDLAVELGPHNIRVNCIAPGLIETRMAQALVDDPKMQAFTQGKLPLRRLGQPDDIAGVVAFLASRAGAFVTGQTLVADGGAVIA